ncbi:hypothetical protein H0H81_009309 [Sphagnurus paluster]|uniref:Uncharacterized protein n=1 Tax=Sphagnurus paluster TaxID=117069 RepID=A0A9P7FS67_9AGAR|nr:hypothetical protein H0H81_009309 [Sphagnurus paluster]
MSIATRRAPYDGISRKLVLAFDVGTTYSGISYRFPAHEKVGGSCKIPTIVYYDQDGKVRAAGAEAIRESLRDVIEDEGWIKAEWCVIPYLAPSSAETSILRFKLHMQPEGESKSDMLDKIPPLPPGKSAIVVVSDFYRYLYGCARTFIVESYQNGPQLWESLESTIDFVLSHPNGWEGKQQQKMRRAAVLADLIPDTDAGHARIRFVTEGETSLHFCLQSGMKNDAFKDGSGVIIIDAGGGTVDLSAYGAATSRTDEFEEISPPQCLLQGSVHVNIRARDFLTDYLKESKFAQDIDAMVDFFDKSAKLAFDSGPLFIKFGGARDRDVKLRIRSGQLTLAGKDVATFFEPSILSIIQAVKLQISGSRKPIKSLFLVGGFSASEYLFSKLREVFEPLGLSLCRPDSHLNKAVADGAVSFYLDHYISVRISRHTYGTKCNQSLLAGGTTKVLTLCTKPFFSEADIFPDPGFTTLCTIEADTKIASFDLKPKLNAKQQEYFQLDFDIILSFGLTELKAQIAWKQDGTEKR